MPRCKKRAAAADAENKIKLALSKWNASDDEPQDGNNSINVCRLSDFDDLDHTQKKKRKAKAPQAKKQNKNAASKKNENKQNVENAGAKKEAKNQKNPSVDSDEDSVASSGCTFFSDSDLSDSPSSDDDTTSEEYHRYLQDQEKRRRQNAAAARQQHSNRPMVLSRRLGRKLSIANISPVFSPVYAERLTFSPEKTSKKPSTKAPPKKEKV